MRFSLAATAIAAIVSLTTATPIVSPTATSVSISTTTPTPAFTWSPANATKSFCKPPTFSQAPDLAPANWRDCAALFSGWADENGTFAITTTPVPILRSGTCTLAVAGMKENEVEEKVEGGSGYYVVGDDDVRGILDGALKNYSQGTNLAARGSVECQWAGAGKKASASRGLAGLVWQVSATET